MNWRAVARMARHDAFASMRTRTWILFSLAPLLMALLVGVFVVAASMILVAIEVVAPEQGPAGHGVALVGVSSAAEARHAETIDALVDVLQRDIQRPPEDVERLSAFMRFLERAARVHRAPSASSGSSDHGQFASARLGGIRLRVLGHVDAAVVRGLVPGRFDAALFLDVDEQGDMVYSLVSDPSLLFSRSMRRRLEEGIDAFNRLPVGESSVSPSAGLTVIDRVRGPIDLRFIRVLLGLATMAIVFLYYSIGAQALAGVFAGEREARTLEVVLSLPLGLRDVLYAKTVGVVIPMALPALFWGGLLWIGADVTFGIAPPWVGFPLFVVTLLFLLTSVGTAVSALSETSTVARHRLGLINLGGFLFSVLVAGLSATFPVAGAAFPLRLLRSLAGADASFSLIPIALLVLTAALGILEIALLRLRRS